MPTLLQLGAKIALAAALVCPLAAPANAAVIENDMALIPSALKTGNKALVLTHQSKPPSQGGGGLFYIDVESIDSTHFRLSAPGSAETYALYYPIAQLAVFDPTYVRTFTPFVSNNPKYAGTRDVVLGPLSTTYFAYWDQGLLGPGNPDFPESYGWVALRNGAAGLEIASSATALGGGIVVGTTTQVPEPSPALLAPLAIAAALLYTRRPGRTTLRQPH